MFSLNSFYRSREWERLRNQIILERVNKDGELICEECGKPIVKKYGAICHHIKELTEDNVNDYNISLNAENIKVIHHSCHNEIHNRFGTNNRHIYLVVGSPCSGKNRFVEDSASKDDIIVDVDKIYEMISINKSHYKSNRLTSNVLQIRDFIVDMIRTRNGKWVNAWVITSKCKPMELKRLAESLNAEVIFINEDIEVCLMRAREERNDYEKFIEEYFENFNRYAEVLKEEIGGVWL